MTQPGGRRRRALSALSIASAGAVRPPLPALQSCRQHVRRHRDDGRRRLRRPVRPPRSLAPAIIAGGAAGHDTMARCAQDRGAGAREEGGDAERRVRALRRDPRRDPDGALLPLPAAAPALCRGDASAGSCAGPERRPLRVARSCGGKWRRALARTRRPAPPRRRAPRRGARRRTRTTSTPSGRWIGCAGCGNRRAAAAGRRSTRTARRRRRAWTPTTVRPAPQRRRASLCSALSGLARVRCRVGDGRDAGRRAGAGAATSSTTRAAARQRAAAEQGLGRRRALRLGHRLHRRPRNRPPPAPPHPIPAQGWRLSVCGCAHRCCFRSSCWTCTRRSKCTTTNRRQRSNTRYRGPPPPFANPLAPWLSPCALRCRTCDGRGCAIACLLPLPLLLRALGPGVSSDQHSFPPNSRAYPGFCRFAAGLERPSSCPSAAPAPAPAPVSSAGGGSANATAAGS